MTLPASGSITTVLYTPTKRLILEKTCIGNDTEITRHKWINNKA